MEESMTVSQVIRKQCFYL